LLDSLLQETLYVQFIEAKSFKPTRESTIIPQTRVSS